MRSQWLCIGMLLLGGMILSSRSAAAQSAEQQFPIRSAALQPDSLLESVPPPAEVTASQATGLPAGLDPDQMLSPSGVTPTLKLLLTLTVLTLAPSILLMTTCFVRFIIVFSLLRMGLGTQTTPPNQVLLSLSLFMTIAVMWPIWQKCYNEGVLPYTTGNYANAADQQEALTIAWDRTVLPMRKFMSDQIYRTQNESTVWMLWDYQHSGSAAKPAPPETFEEIPLSVLVPAFMISEIKTAFVIGFQVMLPFLVIDMVVSSVLISMGMMMQAPSIVSLPIKILLFVLIDGWALIVESLLASVQAAV